VGFRRLVGDADVREVRRSLAERGWSVIPGFVDSAAIDGIVADARRLYESHPQHVAHESNGSDARIYGADRICASLRLEREMSVIDRIASSYYWPSATVNFQLLGWIRHREGNLGSGAGWHRDSPFSHQFKALLYLSDVTEDNGPFEFIEGSHRRASLLTAAGSLAYRWRSTAFRTNRLRAAGGGCAAASQAVHRQQGDVAARRYPRTPSWQAAALWRTPGADPLLFRIERAG
jgi:ectoine hydroxylase-related dioxygenase (phytanoyl-CoA dioxygenase family)